MFLAQVANTIAKSGLQLFRAVQTDARLVKRLQIPNFESNYSLLEKSKTLKTPRTVMR